MDDIDLYVGFWLNDIPYIYINGTSHTTYRYYITPKGIPLLKHSDKECLWINNYFGVISLYDYYNKYSSYKVRVNGVDYNNKVWLMYFKPYIDTDIIEHDGSIRNDLSKRIMKHVEEPPSQTLNIIKHTFKNRRKEVPRNVKEYVIDITNNNFPTAKYDSRITPNNIHWGQLKLILSEIEFLTNKVGNSPTVVLYIGGAPGNHIPFISMMFPNILFILYDPLHFTIKETSRIIIYQEYFRDEMVPIVKNLDCVLISDIRTPKMTNEQFINMYPLHSNNPKLIRKGIDAQFEKDIIDDMELQRKIITNISPKSAMLKFRLGFPPKIKQTYLSSQSILIQPFAKPTSTEQRMWLDNDKEYKTKDYNLSLIEEKFFYFNTQYRPATFYDIDETYGYNYDTLRMADILRQYIKNVGILSNILPPPSGVMDMNNLIFSLVYGIESTINRQRDKHQITNMF